MTRGSLALAAGLLAGLYLAAIVPARLLPGRATRAVAAAGAAELLLAPQDAPAQRTAPLLAPVAWSLPFTGTWTYSGGPHGTAAGNDAGLHAVDFWPPSQPGCGAPAPEWALATAPGVVDAVGDGWVSIAHGGGWLSLSYHIGPGKPAVGTILDAGDPVGHPACVGLATGTAAHLHLVYRHDGAWTLPPQLSGWTFAAGDTHYTGWASGPGGEQRCPSAPGAAWPGCRSDIAREGRS